MQTNDTFEQRVREWDARRERVEAEAQRYAERFPGWRPSRAKLCPRVVAGKRCTRGYPRRSCICQEIPGHPLMDHKRMWITPDGWFVLTSEPYDVAPNELATLRARVAELGLTVDVEDDSPYRPGGTKLLLIRDASTV